VRLVCWSAVSTPWRALDKEAVTSFWRPEPRSSLPPISRGAESSDLHGGIQQRLVSPVARHAYHRGGVPSESTQVKSQLADRVQALGGAISSRVPPGKPPPRQSRSRSVADSQSVRTFLHGDVKPANVYLCDDGRVVLIDFGIACSMLDEASYRTQMLAGSPLYTAPERLRGSNPEPACDMFSLGATLFAAVEGKPPFSGSSLFNTVIAVVEGEPAPCLHAGPLRAVIEGLLAKNPADRLTGDQARTALVDLQQRLRPGAVTEVVEGGVSV
jgi:serine/threonine protein kinase